jgi:hypothetical protein
MGAQTMTFPVSAHLPHMIILETLILYHQKAVLDQSRQAQQTERLQCPACDLEAAIGRVGASGEATAN